MLKRGVSSQPKIGTNNLGLDGRKKRLNLIWFWMKNKKPRFKGRGGLNFWITPSRHGQGGCFASVASLEAI